MTSVGAPQFDLANLLERGGRALPIIGCQPMSRDTFAKAIGFCGIHGHSNLAISAMLQMGIARGMSDAKIALTQEFDAYHGCRLSRSNAEWRRQTLLTWFRRPAMFVALQSEFAGGMPSVAEVVASLRKRGLSKEASAKCARAFIKSAQMVGFYRSSPMRSDDLIARDGSPARTQAAPASGPSTEKRPPARQSKDRDSGTTARLFPSSLAINVDVKDTWGTVEYSVEGEAAQKLWRVMRGVLMDAVSQPD